MISQCYDCASVMSGTKWGVQKLIQQRLNKEIHYVHFFNHILHLIVERSISHHEKVEEYFATCSTIYYFNRKQQLSILFEGDKIKKAFTATMDLSLFDNNFYFEKYRFHNCSFKKMLFDFQIAKYSVWSSWAHFCYII